MTEKLILTVNLAADKYHAVLTVVSSVLPQGVFYYRNTDTTTLGEFAGVVDLAQLTLYPLWTGLATPSFGAPYVRHNSAEATFSTKDELTQWSSALKNDLAALRLAVESSPSTTTEILF